MADPGPLTASPEAAAPAASEPGTVACRNCGTPVPLRFCTRCGQRRDAGAHSLRRMLAEFADDQLSLEARLPRTVWALLARPGVLTREYAAGRVARYVRPFRLFLVSSVVLFLAVSFRLEPLLDRQAAEIREAASEPAAGEAEGPGIRISGGGDPIRVSADTAALPRWIRPAIERVRERADELNRLPEDVRARAILAGTLDAATRVVFVLVPVLASLLLLLHFRRRRLFAEHFVFALHYHAAAFALITIGLLAMHPAVWIAVGLYHLVYLFQALRTVYAQRWYLAALKLLAVISVYPTFVGLFATAAAMAGFFLG